MPTILVVEDNPVEQKIVSMLASRLGVDVELAGTAYKAIDLLSRNSDYCAVFMNCMLPAMNGLECTQEIRRLDSQSARVPIIALTALPDGIRQTCLEAGMDDFLSKPYTPEQFKDVLDRWLAVVPAGRRRS